MNAEAWTERAERLRKELARLHAANTAHVCDNDLVEAQKRVVIARWLRNEFGEEVPEDTQTLALFPDLIGSR